MTILRAGLALTLLANGLWMLLAPRHWYLTLPGVIASGDFNAHFVRDIGAAYSLGGVAFALLCRWPTARPYALAASAFLLAHGAIHIAEGLLGWQTLAHLAADLPGVVLLPLLAFAAAWRVDSNIDKERPHVASTAGRAHRGF